MSDFKKRAVVISLTVAAVGLSYDLAVAQSSVTYTSQEFYAVHPVGKPAPYFAVLVAPPPFETPGQNYSVDNAIKLETGVTVLKSDNASIPSGILGHMAPVNTESPTLWGVNVGPSSVVNDVMSQASLRLAQNSRANGNVTAANNVQVESGVVVTGTITSGTGGVAVKRPALRIAFPDDAWTAVNVNAGTTVSLAPGAYHNVNVAGTLNLSAGYYYFNELTTQAGSTLNFPATGNIVLNIKWKLLHGATITNPTSVAPRLAVLLRAGGPAAINSRWAGTLFAPNDIIEVKNVSQQHLGMFIGYQVKLLSGATVKHVPLTNFATIFPGFDVHNQNQSSNDTCSLRTSGVVTSTPPTVGEMQTNLSAFIARLTTLENQL